MTLTAFLISHHVYLSCVFTQHGDCQIVLMEEDRFAGEDQVELEKENRLNNDKELSEEVSKTVQCSALQRNCFLGLF